MVSKEIKKEAKNKLTNNYMTLVIINALFLLFTLACSYAISSLTEIEKLKYLGSILSIIFIVFTYPFAYGIIASTIKKTRSEDVGITEFINIGLKNFGKTWKVFFRTFLKLLIPLLIFVIITVLLIVAIIIYSFASAFQITESSSSIEFIMKNPIIIILVILYILDIIYLGLKSLYYSLTFFVLYDNNDKPSKEIVEESKKLMTGQRWNYIKLCLSFIGWYLLIGFITSLTGEIALNLDIPFSNTLPVIINNIGSILLTPYISVSTLVFYENLKNNNTEPKKNNE